jgi:hypothetical protein
LYRYTWGEQHCQEEQGIPPNQNDQPIEMRVLMVIRESPEEMSRMLTESVRMDFDLLIPALVQIRTHSKPRHFGDVMLAGKLLSPNNVYFQIENGNLSIIGQNMPQMDLSCMASNVV